MLAKLHGLDDCPLLKHHVPRLVSGLSPWDEDSPEKCASDLVHLDGHTNPQAQAWEMSLPPPTMNHFSFFLSC